MDNLLNYFAYGSNMSVQRLRQRVPSAQPLGVYKLPKHCLRFHKIGQDGSGKCDAFFSNNDSEVVFGVLYEMNLEHKPLLDTVEGLGVGYGSKAVQVEKHPQNNQCNGAHIVDAFTYYALQIDASMIPFNWYKIHVVTGAEEAGLPSEYLALIDSVVGKVDDDSQREAKELAIYL